MSLFSLTKSVITCSFSHSHILLSVPNYNSEVYGAHSICVEVDKTTVSDPHCIPSPGMRVPQCHPRQLMQESATGELAINISINGIVKMRDSVCMNVQCGKVATYTGGYMGGRGRTWDIPSSPPKNLSLPRIFTKKWFINYLEMDNYKLEHLQYSELFCRACPQISLRGCTNDYNYSMPSASTPTIAVPQNPVWTHALYFHLYIMVFITPTCRGKLLLPKLWNPVVRRRPAILPFHWCNSSSGFHREFCGGWRNTHTWWELLCVEM